jgi:hypothetical protein
MKFLRLKTGILIIMLTTVVLLAQPIASASALRAAASPGSPASIVLEGENASTHNWSPGVRDNAQMSGGKYLELYADQLDATGAATATYTFTAAKAGLYSFVIWSTPASGVGWASPYRVKLNDGAYQAPVVKQYATHPIGSVQKLESTFPVELRAGTNTVSIQVNQRRSLDNKYVTYLDLLMFTPWVEWIKFHVEQYRASGDISAALADQLGADLTQAQSRVDAGAIAEAKRYLGEFLQHLNQPDAAQYASQVAKDTLTQMANNFMLQVSPERKAFDAYASNPPAAVQRYLYVIDKPDMNGGELLFTTLLSNEGKQAIGSSTYIVYVKAWAQIRNTASRLNLSTLPAAVITDDRLTIQGALTNLASSGTILQFLANPKAYGQMPTYPTLNYGNTQPLQNGKLATWLTAGTWSGKAGFSGLGVDSEQELRPNPGEPFSRLVFQTTYYDTWQQTGISPNVPGGYVLEEQMPFPATWGYGTAYAFAYLWTYQSITVTLHTRQSGVQTTGWLDGKAIQLRDDSSPPSTFPAFPQGAEAAKAAVLQLGIGWHTVLLKFVTKQDQGQRFYFAAQFTDSNGGNPPVALSSQTWEHSWAFEPAINREAMRLLPLTYVNAPANLPRVTDTISLTVDLRWFKRQLVGNPTLADEVPFIPFQAKVRLVLTDFSGQPIKDVWVDAVVPNANIRFDLGIKLRPGYYATHLSLYHPTNGKRIATYYADGFSVVAGGVAQKERVAQKKVWDNYYYVTPSNWDHISTWLERAGIYRIVGSYPLTSYLTDPSKPILENAKQRGLTLMGDFGADSPSVNTTRQAAQQYVSVLSQYTCFFKSINELDIRTGSEWVPIRTPENWIQRQQWEYELVHQACPNGTYIGPSLARPAHVGAEKDWFSRVVQLGMDRYLDAWDVHAYPQNPPLLGGTIGNADDETDVAVLKVLQEQGKTNTKPFWLGETGALPWHGYDGLRWQADTTAKMVAWANSRSDYKAIAFLIAHDYTRSFAYGEFAYASGHRPGEAALYTASALIDGFSYRKVASGSGIEAAWFGNTFMLWSTGNSQNWTMQLDRSSSWVVVDSVGRTRPLSVGSNGQVTLQATQSPVYVLKAADYANLIRF